MKIMTILANQGFQIIPIKIKIHVYKLDETRNINLKLIKRKINLKIIKFYHRYTHMYTKCIHTSINTKNV
jgi:hypothetical protein